MFKHLSIDESKKVMKNYEKKTRPQLNVKLSTETGILLNFSIHSLLLQGGLEKKSRALSR